MNTDDFKWDELLIRMGGQRIDPVMGQGLDRIFQYQKSLAGIPYKMRET